MARSEVAPLACSSAITGAGLKQMALVAELEAGFISDRTKAALAAAKRAARAAAASALASAPFWRAFAVSFAPAPEAAQLLAAAA